MFEPITEPIAIKLFHGRWRLFDKLGVVVVSYGSCDPLWKLQSGKYAFVFDLVLKRDGRLLTKLDLLVRHIIYIYILVLCVGG
jgi:hypothetical protein